MKYQRLTKYIDIFKDNISAGEWVADHEHKGTFDDPKLASYVEYSKEVINFMDDFYESGIAVEDYVDVLAEADISENLFDTIDFHTVDVKVVEAILTCIVRAEVFCEGYLMEKIEKGTVTRVLEYLAELDENEALAITD